MGGSLLLQACDRDLSGPTQSPGMSRALPRAVAFDPGTNIADVLDSFSIGGVYTVLPVSGYPRNAQTIPFAPAIFVYTRSPEDTGFTRILFHAIPRGLTCPRVFPYASLRKASWCRRRLRSSSAGIA
jgi:hypothetical protein